MNRRNYAENKRINRWAWLAVVILVLVAAIALILYRFKDEKRFAVVKLYGKGLAFNLSKNYKLTAFTSDTAVKGALLTEEGDLLGINNTFIHLTSTSEDSMQIIDNDDSLVFVNGKVNSIVISAKEDLLPWFRNMNAVTINHLQSIRFNGKIPGSYIPFLKEIARLKPNTALVFEQTDSVDILNEYVLQADFFSPRFINVTVTQHQFSQLPHFKNVECLYMDIADSVVTIPLPAMPALKQCIIYGDELKSISPDFFKNNVQLEKITLMKSLDDYALLQPLGKLQELSLNNAEKDAGVAVSQNQLSNLSVLIIAGNYNHVDALTGLKKLRWLGLPANTSQQQFNTIATQLKELEVLELQGSDSITNLGALQQLHNLKGLVITDTVTDKQALYMLKELRYLSVPNTSKTDSIYLLALQKTLPGCIVVPNSGACLGSGWLLLLIPMAIILVFVLNQRVIKHHETT
ncbi:leucine-rich repeat domain-containing protein [Ferruginibacter profundus]